LSRIGDIRLVFLELTATAHDHAVDLERVERIHAAHGRHTRRHPRDQQVGHRANLPSAALTARRPVGAQSVKEGLEGFWRRLGCARHRRKPLKAISFHCRERQPFPRVRVVSDRVVPVSGAYGPAIVADVLSALPVADALVEHLPTMRFDESELGAFYGGLPLAVAFGFLSLACKPSLFGVGRLGFDLAQDLAETVLQPPALAIAPAGLTAAVAEHRDVELAGGALVERSGRLR
jgi:hypothetical protein